MKDLPLATHTTPCYSFVTKVPSFYSWEVGKGVKAMGKDKGDFSVNLALFLSEKETKRNPFLVYNPWCVLIRMTFSSLYFHNN
jgi:hypothetical protein